jgi:putative transposase
MVPQSILLQKITHVSGTHAGHGTDNILSIRRREGREYSYVPIPEVGYLRNTFTAYDLQKILKIIKPERGFIVHSTTIQEVIAVHAKSRKQFKTDKLRWRVSGGARRSLGWVPFKSGAAKWKSGQVYFAGHSFKVWDSYGLSNFEFRSGSFSQDARGRWYFNSVVSVPVEKTTRATARAVGERFRELDVPF